MTDLERKAIEMAFDAAGPAMRAAIKKIEELRAENKALRQALAQPEQEPISFEEWIKDKFGLDFMQEEPLTYFRMQAAWNSATPPKREWVGLTRAERFEIERAMSKYYDYQHECKTVCLPEFAAAIEAKLKEKNT